MLLVSVTVVAAFGQKTPRSHRFVYNDSTVIQIANNYSRNLDVDYQPYDIRLPFKDQHYLVYGKRLAISVFRMKELLDNGGYSVGGSFRDTLPEDAHVFETATMYYQAVRNGKEETGWLPVSEGRPYTDSFYANLNRPYKHWPQRGLMLYDALLENGDSLVFRFRQRQDAPFLTMHFRKADAMQSPPFLMYGMDNHNPSMALPDFVRDVFEKQHAITGNAGEAELFYEDWPGRREPESTPPAKLFPDTKSALIFRPRHDVPNDSAFEYRLLINGDTRAAWRKSNNIIIVADLQSGSKYRLEVRYADKPNYVFVKRFYVPGRWYQEPWFLIVSVLGLLLLAGLLFYRFRNRWRKRQQEAQRMRIRALYTQLNPHFLFNALGSIQGLLNEGEVEKANHYLSGFGGLLRNTLQNGDRDSISLDQELKHLQSYIRLEQLRQPFDFTLDVAPGVNLAAIDMLPLLFQPIVENAVKHGFRGKGEMLALRISVRQQGADLLVEIADNGKGFDTSRPAAGKGLQLTADRIALFNQAERGKKVRLQLESAQSGTTAYFTFKNWLDD
ncbi:sensor histidine kinase [Chitinophaga rhizosphaerae]|uniref:sensor histidine kinase n=1 Tax=Chitinophaga rhizosphaerae TaxID=1864947 RepID=UPI0013DF9C8D|nr:histidine kinase [Chitinophaga rhizosphaerae]